MAQFRNGQRVRVIGYRTDPHIMGKEGNIVGPDGADFWIVFLPGVPHVGDALLPEYHYSLPSYRLSPLTDPKADQLIERIKKIGKEPINDAPKVTVREGE